MAKQIFGSGTLAIGTTSNPTDQYECQVKSFTVTSSSNLIPIPATLCQGPTQAAQPSTYSVSLTHMQDYGAAAGESLSQLLWDNDGALLYFDYTPTDVTASSCAGSFYAVAGDYGGDGQGLWTSTDEMPCPEKPTLTPPA